MLYDEAMKVGKLRMGPPPTAEELAEIEALMVPKDPVMYGLRNPKDAKTPADYLRLGFQQEDAAFLEENKRKTIKVKEQKKLPREVLTEQWDEDQTLYKHKRNN